MKHSPSALLVLIALPGLTGCGDCGEPPVSGGDSSFVMLHQDATVADRPGTDTEQMDSSIQDGSVQDGSIRDGEFADVLLTDRSSAMDAGSADALVDDSAASDALVPDHVAMEAGVTDAAEIDGTTRDSSATDIVSEDAQQEDAATGEENCSNGDDDNGDGLADCADPLCENQHCNSFGSVCVDGACLCLSGHTAEIDCSDLIDNDCNGLRDCAESSCASDPLCGDEVCDDGFDNNGDNLVDCQDSSCDGVSCCGNRAPSGFAEAIRQAEEGQLYTYALAVVDPDGPQAPTCAVAEQDSCGGTLDSCSYSFTPDEEDGGSTCQLVVAVFDGCATTLQQVTLSITETNQTPVITSQAPAQAAEAQVFSYTVEVSDPDLPAQQLTCSVADDDTCGGLFSGCLYQFVPDESMGGGSCQLAVQVADPVGLVASQSQTVQVAETNVLPEVTSQPASWAHENAVYVYTLQASDGDDPAQTLRCLLSPEDSCGGALDGCTYSFTPDETQGGSSCIVGLRVSDTVSHIDQDSEIQIGEQYQAPQITSTPESTATEGSAFSYTIEATDADLPAETLSCSLGQEHSCSGELNDCVFSLVPDESLGGETCQLAFLVSDSGEPAQSTLQVATLDITEVNQPPTVSSIGPTSAVEQGTYEYQLDVVDADLPAQELTCSLSPADSCGGLLLGCLYRFYPGEAQGGDSCVVGVRVTDSGTPELYVDHQVTVQIEETNLAPLFLNTPPATAVEGQLYQHEAQVLDQDVPTQTLGCSRSLGDTCQGILDACTYLWIPEEDQGGQDCVVGISVTDSGSPLAFTEQNTVVSVAEVNSAPFFRSSPTDSAAEQITYSYTLEVGDSDLPTQTLTCSIAEEDTCQGSLIDCNSYSFTPDESLGGDSCLLAIVLSDSGNPAQQVTQSLSVAISENNSVPTIVSTAPAFAAETEVYSYAVIARDSDLPAQTLNCAVSGDDSCGGTLTGCDYQFVAPEVDGQSSCVVGVQVSDDGTPVGQVSQLSTVTIIESNHPPRITSSVPASASEGEPYLATLTVTDSDLPAQNLSCALSAADSCGGSLSACDSYSFTPDETQGGSDCVVGIRVEDDGEPLLHVEQNTPVFVEEDNQRPQITSTAPTEASEGLLYSYLLTGTDADLPAQTLTCLFSNGHSCGGQLVGCQFTMTPDESQGGTTCVVGLRLRDNGLPRRQRVQNTTVTVHETNQPPVITSTAGAHASEAELFTYTITATDADLPAQTLSCGVDASDSCGGNVVDCSYTLTPTEAQGGQSCVIGIKVSDNGSPTATVVQQSSLQVLEVNQRPQITSTPPTEATENTQYSYALGIEDADLPAQDLHCWRKSADTCGGELVGCTAYRFTPGENRGGTTCQMVWAVRDNGDPALAQAQTQSISILEDNQPPLFTSMPPSGAVEGQQYTYLAVVQDSDRPVQATSCSLSPGDTCGGALTDCQYSFVPDEPTGGASCVIGIRATDNGSPSAHTDQDTVLDVAEDNTDPLFTNTPPTSAAEGQLYLYLPTIEDVDLPPQELVCNRHSIDTCNGTMAADCSSYSWVPDETQGGTGCLVAVRVIDQQGGRKLVLGMVNVAETNQAPVFTSTSQTYWPADEPGWAATYPLTASDPDIPSQHLTFAIDEDLETCGGWVGTVGSSYLYGITLEERLRGTSCTMAVLVSDGAGGVTSQSAEWTFEQNNVNPDLANLPASPSVLHRSFALEVVDEDLPGDHFTYELDEHSCALTADVDAEGVVSWQCVETEDCTLGVQVTDDGIPPRSGSGDLYITCEVCEDPSNILTCDETTCWPARWVGDGYCDARFDCPEYGNDGGDCELICGDGAVMSCDGSQCFPASYLNDMFCDEALNCEEHQWDGLDCQRVFGCARGLVLGCDDECIPAAWINDGFDDEGLMCLQYNQDGARGGCAQGQLYHISSHTCIANTLGDGTCDEHLNIGSYNYDAGDCPNPRCSDSMRIPSCTDNTCSSWPANGYCDPEFLCIQADWDRGDCDPI